MRKLPRIGAARELTGGDGFTKQLLKSVTSGARLHDEVFAKVRIGKIDLQVSQITCERGGRFGKVRHALRVITQRGQGRPMPGPELLDETTRRICRSGGKSEQQGALGSEALHQSSCGNPRLRRNDGQRQFPGPHARDGAVRRGEYLFVAHLPWAWTHRAMGDLTVSK